jgi:nucleoside-diphosphate-sugar epimerase
MSSQRPTVLVTGATGFVGSHLVRDARAAGLNTIALTRRPTPSAGAQRVVTGWSVPALTQALEHVDVVIHGAAVVPRPGERDQAYTRFNIEETRNLIEACKAQRVRRIVYLSTVKVYGESSFVPMDEQTRVAPRGVYASTKLAAERLLAQAEREGGPELVILRLCSVFGVGDKGSIRTMIQAIARRRFAVPGDGLTRKSLVHVSVVTAAALAAATSSARGVFVIADPVVPTIAQLSQMISRALGRRVPPHVPAAALYVSALGVEVAARCLGKGPSLHRDLVRKALLPSICNPARAEHELGVNCHVDLAEALHAEVTWLRGIGEL